MTASFKGYVEVVRALIGYEAQLNIQDEVAAATTKIHTAHHTITHNITIFL